MNSTWSYSSETPNRGQNQRHDSDGLDVLWFILYIRLWTVS